MLKLFLWLRYLRKKRIVFLSIAAVALSVALLIIIDNLFTGYINALDKSLTANTGEIFLRLSGRAITDYDLFIEKLQQLEDVEAAAPCHFGAGLLYLETGDVREVSIQGIEPAKEKYFTNWSESLIGRTDSSSDVSFEVPGYPEDNGCWIGIGIVSEPNVKTDEYDLEEIKSWLSRKVVLTTTGYSQAKDDAGSTMPKRRVIKLRVSDVASTETYFGDNTLYLPFDLYYKIRYPHSKAAQARDIKIKLKPGTDKWFAKGKIWTAWETFATEQLNWNEQSINSMTVIFSRDYHGDYFNELRKQMGVLLMIFSVICSIAILLIFCIFYMIVETKLKDIAIIKSCGATSRAVAAIFLGFGACVGIVASAIGVVLGWLVTTNINTLEQWIRIVFGIKLWRSSSYMLNVIPSQVDWPGVWPIVLAAVAGCCLGVLIPAIVAARVQPVKILRYE